MSHRSLLAPVLKEVGGNTRIEIASTYRIGSYVREVDLGDMEHRRIRGVEEYMLYINMENGGHRTNPSSIARTLTHESLHPWKRFSYPG